MILFQKIVLQRLNQVTADEVLKYAKQYGIQVTKTQAFEVEKLVKGKNINIFNEEERNKLLKQVEAVTSKEAVQLLNQLFAQYVS
ncbi:DUF2624 domain-containing protein [Bacillus haynesii]|uniref:DUF2624 domain-containing protein n=1 Tax=Bacillus haynesii TaxID=1925021 RepID=UPI001F42DC75|nr:DUF2624 domain-containing protein [Bacillus haynesii]UIN44775.1 DUF2624 domain-containing protein [Bacillus licheniformis]MCY7993400.1 DUF2624 domain-containing protein [Bacillus haynesii]MCY8542211.1 DUF2624 domain-containing protein [Bacillus haynesii]MCY8571200.1 DUF2624 domain-containing protein [Bacillus haynesii]MCY8574999.1 DUF2624 domain-containing protein [Bacillus haynesii]